MSRMVHEFSSPVQDGHEKRYTARVRGDEDHAGQWQGWLEFVPHDGDILLGTDRETSQSSYEHLEYWATGLDAGEGEPTRHSFVVHARDLSEVVTAANWIWTHVRDTDARLRVGGRAVAPESDALVAALAGKG